MVIVNNDISPYLIRIDFIKDYIDSSVDNQIMIDDRLSLESQWFNEVRLVDSIENVFARDPGYILYRKRITG